MGLIYTFLAICVAGFSLLQASIGFISYKRIEKSKLLFVSSAFLIFGLKGVYALLTVFTNFAPVGQPLREMLLIDLVVISLLYLSILKE